MARGHRRPTVRRVGRMIWLEPVSKILGGFVKMFAYFTVAVAGFFIGSGLILAAHLLGMGKGGKVVDTIHKLSMSIASPAGELAEQFVILCGEYPVLGVIVLVCLCVWFVIIKTTGFH